MFENNALNFFFLIIFVLFIAGIKILRDQERFAVILLGKFQKFKGPGIVVNWPSAEIKRIKVSVGDRGEVLTPGWVHIRDRDLPFKSDNSIQVGNIVRIMGFTEDKLIVAYDNNQERSMICENCGHENILA
jgi:regulator of protease activity HflC (stomatin/prohibitin superfamily)